ncbi:MAG: heme-binding domain-containing protein [Saprospiraceae bacterium]
MNKKKIILLSVIAIILGLQFVQIDTKPLKIDPKHHLEQAIEVPDHIKIMLDNACNNCHSAKTNYPWYSKITVVALWLRGHVNGGRQHINFAEWGTYDNNKKIQKLGEIIEVLEQKRMPLKSYKMVHPEARLSDEDYQSMLIFFKNLQSQL